MHAWWDNFYSEDTAQLYLERDPKVSDKLSQFLTKTLHLSSGKRLFDQCCGIGSVSLPLASQHVQLIGIDITQTYIDKACEQSQQMPHCVFLCKDAFDFIPSQKCHAAINWYGSFGYADSDEQNIKMIQNAYDALLPGGFFALDFMNSYGIIKAFKPTMIRANKSVKIVRSCRIDYFKGTLEQDWNYYKAGQFVHKRHSSVQLYLPHQLQKMLYNCGFEQLQLFGDIDANPFSEDSPRCIIIGKKP